MDDKENIGFVANRPDLSSQQIQQHIINTSIAAIRARTKSTLQNIYIQASQHGLPHSDIVSARWLSDQNTWIRRSSAFMAIQGQFPLEMRYRLDAYLLNYRQRAIRTGDPHQVVDATIGNTTYQLPKWVFIWEFFDFMKEFITRIRARRQMLITRSPLSTIR